MDKDRKMLLKILLASSVLLVVGLIIDTYSGLPLFLLIPILIPWGLSLICLFVLSVASLDKKGEKPLT